MPRKVKHPAHVQESTIQLKFADGHEEAIRFQLTTSYGRLGPVIAKALKNGKSKIGHGAFEIKILSRKEVEPGKMEALFRG